MSNSIIIINLNSLRCLQEGVYVYGLFLEGAGWDIRTSRVVQSSPKILFVVLPVVKMYAILTAVRDARQYQCPVYKTPRRTDLTYVSFIMLACTKNPATWIMRAVAALCDTK